MELYRFMSQSIGSRLVGGVGNEIQPKNHNIVLKDTVSYIDNKLLHIGSAPITSQGADTYVDIAISPPLPSNLDPRLDTVFLGSLYTPGQSVNSNLCRNFFMIRNYSTTGFTLLLRAPRNPGAITYTFEYVIFGREEYDYSLPSQF